MSNSRRRDERKREVSANFDEGTERLVIGYCLVDTNSFWDVMNDLQPEDFATARLGRIWAAMQQCGLAHKRPRPEIVGIYIRGDKGEATALRTYLEIIRQEAEDQASAIDLKTDIATIKHFSAKRALLDSMREAIVQIETSEPLTPVEDMQSAAISKLIGATTKSGNRYITSYADAARELVEQIDYDRRQGDEGISRGLRAGLRGVEEVIGPLLPEKVYVLAGMSGAGKTAIAKSITEAASVDAKEKGLGDAYMASLEMSGRELAARSLAERLGMSSYRLERSQVNEDEFARLATQGIEHAARIPIWIDRTPNMTLDKIRANMIAQKNQRGLSLGVIDHILLVRFGSKESLADRVMEAVISAKVLSGELGVPIILLSQVKEKLVIDSHNGRPNTTHLFGGEAIQQNADVTAFIHRPEIVIRAKGPDGRGQEAEANYETRLERAKGKAVFYNGKGRGHGAGIERDLIFDGPTVSFRDP